MIAANEQERCEYGLGIFEWSRDGRGRLVGAVAVECCYESKENTLCDPQEYCVDINRSDSPTNRPNMS